MLICFTGTHTIVSAALVQTGSTRRQRSHDAQVLSSDSTSSENKWIDASAAEEIAGDVGSIDEDDDDDDDDYIYVEIFVPTGAFTVLLCIVLLIWYRVRKRRRRRHIGAYRTIFDMEDLNDSDSSDVIMDRTSFVTPPATVDLSSSDDSRIVRPSAPPIAASPESSSTANPLSDSSIFDRTVIHRRNVTPKKNSSSDTLRSDQSTTPSFARARTSTPTGQPIALIPLVDMSGVTIDDTSLDVTLTSLPKMSSSELSTISSHMQSVQSTSPSILSSVDERASTSGASNPPDLSCAYPSATTEQNDDDDKVEKKGMASVQKSEASATSSSVFERADLQKKIRSGKNY